MKRLLKKKSAHAQMVPSSPTPKKKRRGTLSTSNLPPLQTQQTLDMKNVVPPKNGPSCPYCGGWVIFERVMDFYSRQTLQKCLNCGRILVNPFLPIGLSQAQQKKPHQTKATGNKIDHSYFFPYFSRGEHFHGS